VDEPFCLLLSGPPGAGKTTVGRMVASRVPHSVCIQSDWFWTTIVNGYDPPWEPVADRQNRVMISSALASAHRMAAGGYSVVLEGIIGPWHFDLVREELGHSPVPWSYAVLRPDLPVCLSRAGGRVAESPEHRDALTDEDPIRHLWNQFADLGPYEPSVLDTSVLSPSETADEIWRRVEGGQGRLTG
jgi:DNA polymerase III delta prime subunit